MTMRAPLTDLPIVLDNAGQVYFRPEGRDMILVGLESGSEVGGSPDRPLTAARPPAIEDMVRRLVARVPWMSDGTFRTAHGGQDGITPRHPSLLRQMRARAPRGAGG